MNLTLGRRAAIRIGLLAGLAGAAAAAVLVVIAGTSRADLRIGHARKLARAATGAALQVAADAETMAPAAPSEPNVLAELPFVRWKTWTSADGLPSNKVFCVRADGDRLWAGTEAGLACLENGRWRTWGVKQGLPHPAVLSLDVSPRTGDLWIGTMGGLARLSGGRIEPFTQLSSGLPNDFVHDVECDADEDHIWAATAMGAGRLDLATGTWTLFTEQNTPMSEPWTYSVAIDKGLVYLGAWGAGVLEMDKRSGRWREYRDPDKEMEIDLLPDDGPVHDVTSAIEYRSGLLWQGTYFGLSRYDGRMWRTYFADDSGLASDFIQFVRTRGRVAWCATDKGLSATDGTRWVTYRRREDGKGEAFATEGKISRGRLVTPSAPGHNFVLGLDFQGSAIWLATENGVSRGETDASLGAAFAPGGGTDAASSPGRPVDGPPGLHGQAAVPTGTAMARDASAPDVGRPAGDVYPAKETAASPPLKPTHQVPAASVKAAATGASAAARNLSPRAADADGGTEAAASLDSRAIDAAAANPIAAKNMDGTPRAAAANSVATKNKGSKPGPAAANPVAADSTAGTPGAAAAPRFRYAGTPDALLPYRQLDVHRSFFTKPPEFPGAGREKAEPQVDEVRIGIIAPLADEDGPIIPEGLRSGIRDPYKVELFGRPMLRAARMAIEEANLAGGYRGKPFRLVVRTDLVQWGQTSNELSEFTYRDGVWAVLGGVDSNHQHVLARAALKTEMPIVNAGSTDPTLLEHAIPWIVRIMNDDRQNAYRLLDYIFRVRGLSRVAVLRVNDRDGRVGVMEFVHGARRLSRPIVIEQRFRNGDQDFAEPLGRIAQAGADGLFLFGSPDELGRIVRQARALGMSLPVFAFDRCVHPRFLEAAGAAAEGVVATASFNPDRPDADWQAFRRRYLARHGEEPDAYAAHAYDGIRLIVDAIRSAGLNRVRIRDSLFARSSFDGVTGHIEFDTTLNNIRPPWLAQVKEGRFEYFQPPGQARLIP